DILIASAQNARPSDTWGEDLTRAPQFCRANPKCLLFDTPDCPRHPGSVLSPMASSHATSFQATPTPPCASLLVLVHGSPDPNANADMFRVVENIRQRGIFPLVEVGFLDCNAPDIPTAIDACVAKGANRVLAAPYFLHTGKHVAKDLPTLLEQGQQRHPHVAFRLGDYLGRSELLSRILADRIFATLKP
ncbi:MAG TPA: CbiX/SirB N-terminal domain-containing protein, partial [Chthonomonadaceae bacterium]|nr:CbiX/SirB N-terminal domain-containing protein [Chthonomonadaceae bacterium]